MSQSWQKAPHCRVYCHPLLRQVIRNCLHLCQLQTHTKFIKEVAQSVPSGRKMTDVRIPTPTFTFTLIAKLTPMVLASALKLRRQQPQTPYNLFEWWHEFSSLNLYAHFPKILSGLVYGFDINFPPHFLYAMPTKQHFYFLL